MEHVRLAATPNLRNPVMLYAFSGWNDAGEAASTAVRTMVSHWGAAPLGEIDPEPFTDFATVRPGVYLADGRRRIRWPSVQLWSASLPGADAIFILGPEPALQWRRFSQQIVGLAEHFDASMTISLGALLADYPHTYPVQVIGTATDAELVDRHDLRRSTYEGPTGIVGVLGDAFSTAGRPAVSLWATVPGYTAQMPWPKASAALVSAACGIIGAEPPIDALGPAIAKYDQRVAGMMAENEDLAAYVTRLEVLMADATEDDLDDDDDDDTVGGERGADERVGDEADVEDLVAEVERFLQQGGPEGATGDD
ncbi:PAC2 family protein [Desertimonas flava]|uniref:PAC2 family protein n=1 Tax=Desertimonas flava TaxID=2064846 RepID=UPI000E346984|nr:PAC2 family protein [Desertimonas flava]